MATTLTARPHDVLAQPDTPPASPRLILSLKPESKKLLKLTSPLLNQALPSPPDSPSSSNAELPSSRLRDTCQFSTISHQPPVYAITAAALYDALDQLASTPLPEPDRVFPWLHGISDKHQLQVPFSNAPGSTTLAQDPALLRGITIVKAGGDVKCSRLIGTVSAEELLVRPARMPGQEVEDKPEGPQFMSDTVSYIPNVRNFKVQCRKLAVCSDVVVYGDDSTPRHEVDHLAAMFSQAQESWCTSACYQGQRERQFNTFVLTDIFATLEKTHPHLVAYDSQGRLNARAVDFQALERKEMADMTQLSEISTNVFVGSPPQRIEDRGTFTFEGPHCDIWIEASDYARVPNPEMLKDVESFLVEIGDANAAPVPLEFPSSGSFGARCTLHDDVDALVDICGWIHKMANVPEDVDEDDRMDLDDGSSVKRARARRILIHCSDGYTESSLLALAYLMFAECLPASEAWIRMHRHKGRNFFAYPSDRFFLEYAQRALMRASPRLTSETLPPAASPLWMTRMDGSLPSRIMPYMYLGNLPHASNPGLLRRLGITHILSVGEPITWRDDVAMLDHEETAYWKRENLLYIDEIQDNGADALTEQFDRCLEFIGKAKAMGGSTLVHCHRGVSRSATICIAEIMSSMSLSFPRAYCFVRARRLNVIIQPHLLFAYELLKWEEHLCLKRGVALRREAEWATIAREIALLNKPYCKE